MTETSMERLLRLADGTRTPVELAALRVHQLMVKLRGRGVEVPVRKTGARNGMPKCPAIPAPA
jgi:hypothetical protein